MKVSLVSVTDSLLPEKLNAEQLITYTARVSNPSNQLNTATSDKLLAYLIKNKHWSPFEQVDMGVEIVTSRAIAQQILRHWSASFQEFSQRYAEVVEMEPVQLRKQGATNRQGGEEVFNPDIKLYGNKTMPANEYIAVILEDVMEAYKKLLEAGVAKECARMILPLTTQTTLYMKMSVRDWIHYLTQRTDPHAQLEHRQIAEEIKKIFISLFPNISKALEWI